MSIKSKRVIYVGPADGSNHKPLNTEGVALSAATLPGMVVQQVVGGLQTNAQAATVFAGSLLIADKDQQRTKSVDDAWVQNENMVAIKPRSGSFFNGLVLAGNNITVRNTALSRSATPGLLKIAATDGSEEIVCYADEVINAVADSLVLCYAS